jgi:hypothetical protein
MYVIIGTKLTYDYMRRHPLMIDAIDELNIYIYIKHKLASGRPLATHGPHMRSWQRVSGSTQCTGQEEREAPGTKDEQGT